MEKSSYYLSKHAHFCLADNHYVFLDLRRDEYFCLGRAHTDALKCVLNRDQWVDERTAGTRQPDTNSDANAVIQALLQKELLVQDIADGKLLAPPSVDVPVASLKTDSDKLRPGIGPAHVWNFLTAAAAASNNLRWRSIERTVHMIEDRKSTHTTAAAVVDNDVISDLFEIFQTLRPYYPRPYLCLFDSLALLYFLAHFGVFPQWVYGVKLEPFAAHCWIQSEGRVVNDVIDNVRNYTPIMSV